MKIKIRKCMTTVLIFISVTLTGYLVTTSMFEQTHTPIIKPYDVLLSAYMNSGSTFTGRLLGFHKDSFYFYEPLWHISLWNYYQGNWSMCSTVTPSCRTLNRLEMNRNKPIPKRRLDPRLIHDIDINSAQPTEVPQKILEHVFNCNLSQIKNLVLPGVTTKDIFSGPSWDSFRHCEKLGKPFEKCLADLETVCRRAKHRVSKVLRMTLGGLETILEHNPRIKVFHLYRDPRAVIHSRIETRGHPLKRTPRGNRDISNSAKALCDKMLIDLIDGLKLKGKFPDRFRFIHYEDLVLNVDSIKEMYKFAGIQFNDDIFRSVYAIKTNEPVKMNSNEERDRQNNNALWWQTHIAMEVLDLVDEQCGQIYPQLGYPIINNVTRLRHISKEEFISGLKFRF